MVLLSREEIAEVVLGITDNDELVEMAQVYRDAVGNLEGALDDINFELG